MRRPRGEETTRREGRGHRCNPPTSHPTPCRRPGPPRGSLAPAAPARRGCGRATRPAAKAGSCGAWGRERRATRRTRLRDISQRCNSQSGGERCVAERIRRPGSVHFAVAVRPMPPLPPPVPLLPWAAAPFAITGDSPSPPPWPPSLQRVPRKDADFEMARPDLGGREHVAAGAWMRGWAQGKHQRTCRVSFVCRSGRSSLESHCRSVAHAHGRQRALTDTRRGRGTLHMHLFHHGTTRRPP